MEHNNPCPLTEEEQHSPSHLRRGAAGGKGSLASGETSVGKKLRTPSGAEQKEVERPHSVPTPGRRGSFHIQGLARGRKGSHFPPTRRATTSMGRRAPELFTLPEDQYMGKRL